MYVSGYQGKAQSPPTDCCCRLWIFMSFSAAHLSHLFSNLLKQIPCCTAGHAAGPIPVTLATEIDWPQTNCSLHEYLESPDRIHRFNVKQYLFVPIFDRSKYAAFAFAYHQHWGLAQPFSTLTKNNTVMLMCSIKPYKRKKESKFALVCSFFCSFVIYIKTQFVQHFQQFCTQSA